MRVPRKIPSNPEVPEKKSAKKPPAKGRGLVIFSLLSALITIAAYYSCTIRPEKYWMAGFTGFLIPPAILLQILLLAFWLWKKPFYALIPALALFLGMRFIRSSFGWHYLITEKCRDFKVLSLNARAFGVVAKDSSGLAEKVNKSIRSIQAAQADIICIQEMYDFPGVRPFHIIKTLKKAGYSHVFFSISEKTWGSRIGMAILSRHPILEEEIIRKKVGSNNQIILARIRIGDRRISVINMHLQSVALREKEFRLARESGEWVDRGLSIGKKLKKGFQNRAGQLDELLKAAAEEGDYVLICGDLNDTPYSNSYLRLRDQYQNAFEEAGRGFGFTFNGEIPFLRIDNQFAGKGFRVSRFDTRKDFPASDHYGTEACYAFKE